MEQSCSQGPQSPLDFSRTHLLSDDEIISLNTYDFMAHLGKRVINPGGLHGRDHILACLGLSPGSSVLEIGCGNGQAACYIAQRYACRVSALDIAPGMIELARQYVHAQGLDDQVQCDVGNVLQLPYPDASFDYVCAQAVLMFIDQAQALAEIKRVLKPGGRFAGLEFSWRRTPPEDVRDQTYHICGCRTLKFYSAAHWAHCLEEHGMARVQAAEHPFGLLSIRGFLRDEGMLNSFRIAGKVLGRKANRVRMTQIWNHFARNLDYFSYVVLAGERSL